MGFPRLAWVSTDCSPDRAALLLPASADLPLLHFVHGRSCWENDFTEELPLILRVQVSALDCVAFLPLEFTLPLPLNRQLVVRGHFHFPREPNTRLDLAEFRHDTFSHRH